MERQAQPLLPGAEPSACRRRSYDPCASAGTRVLVHVWAAVPFCFLPSSQEPVVHGHNNNTTILLLLLGIAALCKHVKHTHTLRVCVSDQQHRRAMHQTHTNWCVCVCVCVRANEWCAKPKTLNRAKHVYDYVCVRMRVYMCLRVRGV